MTINIKAEKIIPYFTLLRPYQWLKNLLVFSGLIFSTSLLKADVFLTSLAAFVIFCIASSSVYILNDLRDVTLDKLHPEKRKRPLASGEIPINKAIIIMSLLVLVSLISAFFLNKSFLVMIFAYLLINIAYSFGLKKVVILDAFLVASGFLIRVFAGCIVINVDASPWLFICTLSLALVISFGKRRNELNILKDDAKNHRESLHSYDIQLLDIILTISSATAIGTYSLYTMAHETVTRFGNQRLIITTLFVMYGLFRYLHLIYSHNLGGDPVKHLIKDTPSVINGIAWVLCIIYIIYGTNFFPII